MNEGELQALAAFAALLLVVSASLQKNWIAAVFGVASTAILVFARSDVATLLSAMIVVPVIIQVRASKKEEKDLLSAVLAAAIIATATSRFLVFQ